MIGDGTTHGRTNDCIGSKTGGARERAAAPEENDDPPVGGTVGRQGVRNGG